MDDIRNSLHKSIDLLDDRAVGLLNELVERLLTAVDFDYTYATAEEEEGINNGWKDLEMGNHVSLDTLL
jgi:hypothetical protein